MLTVKPMILYHWIRHWSMKMKGRTTPAGCDTHIVVDEFIRWEQRYTIQIGTGWWEWKRLENSNDATNVRYAQMIDNHWVHSASKRQTVDNDLVQSPESGIWNKTMPQSIQPSESGIWNGKIRKSESCWKCSGPSGFSIRLTAERWMQNHTPVFGHFW